MLTRRFFGLLALLGLLLLTAGTLAAFAAANTVPPTHADDLGRAIDANALKPAACAALNLIDIVVGSGSFDGTSGNDLILGGSGADTIQGGDGSDCILGGDGNDVLQGQQGDDIILAGNGDDILRGGQDTDVCDGEGGNDIGHPSCESAPNIP